MEPSLETPVERENGDSVQLVGDRRKKEGDRLNKKNTNRNKNNGEKEIIIEYSIIDESASLEKT